jgi:hypothetical protein
LKISKPTEFCGSDKDSIDVDTFLLQCELYFANYPTATDGQKNAFILSFCKGSASKWAEAYIKQNLGATGLTYPQLTHAMIAMWGVVNKEEKAARELDALKQSTSSVAEYVSAFKQKATQCSGFSDFDLRRRFRTGLQQRVRDQLAHISPGQKNTIDKLVAVSLEIGQNFEELDAEKKMNRWTPRGQQSSYTAERTVSQGGNAMDVDANKQRGGPRPQGQQGGKGFKCYRCGKEGHMARNCTDTEKPRNAQVKATEVVAEEPKKSSNEDLFKEFLEFRKGKKDF